MESYTDYWAKYEKAKREINEDMKNLIDASDLQYRKYVGINLDQASPHSNTVPIENINLNEISISDVDINQSNENQLNQKDKDLLNYSSSVPRSYKI